MRFASLSHLGPLAVLTALLSAGTSVNAQTLPITPAVDGTGTLVNATGDRLDITGGTQSGQNLFHSFQQFGLNQGQIANFLSNSSIQNILGRVTGGDPSVINGLIQVTGGNSNLYLMNPAGIVFGSSASLNVSGSFLATTANGIGLGNGAWFSAIGSNNYADLAGNPTAFAFLSSQPGAILNAGNLAVGQGQSLMLLGGTVINTGTLSAPGGTITIAAVPGEKLVRISDAGSLLSLDLPTADKAAINPPLLTPLSLPALLTGGNIPEATGVTVENGVVKLTSSGTVVDGRPGTAIASGTLTTASTSSPVPTAAISILGDRPSTANATINPGTGKFQLGFNYLFIDTNVTDYQTLAAGATGNTDLTLIQPGESGIGRVSDRLASVINANSVQIVADGNVGNFWLGRDFVSSETLPRYSSQLQQWKQSLATGADLLLLSCFTAQGVEGQQFIQTIASLTGADVAASTDLTGSAALGGNWNLEYTTGPVKTPIVLAPDVMNTYTDKLAVFTVTNTADAGANSLRQAILDANATAGLDDIVFAITPTSASYSIAPTSALPTITDPVNINGFSQRTFDGLGAGAPIVELNGAGAGAGVDGLALVAGSGGSTVQGLVINRFSQRGIFVLSNGNTISGNYIGTDVTGTIDRGNTFQGILLQGGASNNLVSNNVISNNDRQGNGIFAANANVIIDGAGTNNNQIAGNLIGTNAAGTGLSTGTPFPHGGVRGVQIINGAQNNTIGGTTPAERNIISGNRHFGYELVGTGTNGNRVIGNYIGTDVTGNVALGNGNGGVQIFVGPTGNFIGGSNPGEGNLISGNGQVVVGTSPTSNGIVIVASNTSNNTVAGNLIGTNSTGTAALANTGNGILINDSPNTVIGGNTTAARNIISGNRQFGIQLAGANADNNTISGNFIGIDSTGNTDLGNSVKGLQLQGGASSNLISNNVISNNDRQGNAILGSNANVGIYDVGTDNNRLIGNFIGTNAAGTGLSTGTPFPNGGVRGIQIAGGAQNNIVGGTTPAERNILSGNLHFGYELASVGTTGNRLIGNYIGTNVTGNVALGNGNGGIQIFFGPTGNFIGGSNPGEGNLISGNGQVVTGTANGIVIVGSNTSNNTVAGNLIGTNSTGGAVLANTANGVLINDSPNNVIGGNTSAARNIISGNGTAGNANFDRNGIRITGGNARGNQILSNYLGTDITGNLDLGNGSAGVFVDNAPNNILGAAGAGNVISGNDSPFAGVMLVFGGTTGTQVRGNIVGLNAAGTVALPNGFSGFYLQGASGNTIGGNTAGDRNIVASNFNDAITITTDSNNNIITGNYLGTDITGTVAVGNRDSGMYIFRSSGNRIGTNADGVADIAERNLISGGVQAGVTLDNGNDPNPLRTANNVIAGNFIGTDVTGTVGLGNGIGAANGAGVRIINGAQGNIIGGKNSPIQGNRIGFNQVGVLADSTTSGNTVLGNAIFSNVSIGIDLGNNGITVNDLGDADTGANNLQNYPVLSLAKGNTVTGSLNSLPNTTFRLEFFSSPFPGNQRQGANFLGFANVTTDAAGNATFSANVANIPADQPVTATATRLDTALNPIETSEFSATDLRITPVAGNSQFTKVTTAFPTNFQVRLGDAYGELPAVGTRVTFVVPGSGASGTFVASATVFSDATGLATAPVFIANQRVGSYQVLAVSGDLPPATFNLINFTDAVPPPRETPVPTLQPLANVGEVAIACLFPDDPALASLDLMLPTLTAYLNSQGGKIAVPLGDLLKDCDPTSLKMLSGNRTVIQRRLVKAISQRIGVEYVRYMTIAFETRSDGEVVVVEVMRSPKPAFLQESNGKSFYVWIMDLPRVLPAQDAERYIQFNFGQ